MSATPHSKGEENSDECDPSHERGGESATPHMKGEEKVRPLTRKGRSKCDPSHERGGATPHMKGEEESAGFG